MPSFVYIRDHSCHSWQAFSFSCGSFFLMMTLGGCAALVPQTMALREAWPTGVPQQFEVGAVPFFPQRDYQCGPAALATTLAHSGVGITPDDLVDQVYLPARQGSLRVEMLAAARRYGRVSYQIAPRYADLLREVAAGNPVIVLQDNGSDATPLWHYAVVVGFDYAAGDVILRSGETRRHVIPFTQLEHTWKKSAYWAMVAMPPERVAATATEENYLTAVMAMARVAAPRASVVAYQTFLDRWPGNLTAGIALANLLYAQGDLVGTEAVLRQAAQYHPDAVIVLNNLAQTLSDRGQHDEARRLIERAAAMTAIADSPYAATVRETREHIRLRSPDERSVIREGW